MTTITTSCSATPETSGADGGHRCRAVLRSATRHRRSMDRFGDDLCQHLLSYLSFEELFRYECVCHQWQRLVFARQRTLNIEYNWTSVFLPTREGLVFARNQSILRKCREVSEVCVNKFVNNRREVFDVINKYCHRLAAIESDFDAMPAATVNRFCHRFGDRLRRVCFHSDNEINRQVFRRFTGVNALDIKAFSDLSFVFGGAGGHQSPISTTGGDSDGEVLVNKLREISFTYTNEDQRRIGSLCARNRRTLRSIEILFSANPLTQKSVNSLFSAVSTLSELRVLVIGCHAEIDESFGRCLRLIATRCLRLKKLDITLSKSQCDVSAEMFQTLDRLRQLRRLSLKLHFHTPDLDPTRVTAEALRHCRHLTHLRVISNHCLITDDFFAAIDRHLPRLQALELWSVDVTDQTFHSLAKLSQLRSIYLVCLKSNARINASVVEEVLMKRCPKIKSVYFRNHSYCLELKN